MITFSRLFCLKKASPILAILPAILLLNSCSQYGATDYENSPKIINVSHYDPKETQRNGRSYTPLDQRNLKRNGALGQIARCSKGFTLDKKCADFLVGADPYGSPVKQANLFVDRLKSIKSSRNIKADKIVLVADIDSKCTVPQMIEFVTQLKVRTGKYPLIYIENGELIRSRLRNATSAQKKILKKCPYWLALYSDKYTNIETPKKLIDATGVWKTWVLWQYGGVEWERGRSVPKHYNAGPWKTPKYFGDMSRPLERNGFNGDVDQLYHLWRSHGWKW